MKPDLTPGVSAEIRFVVTEEMCPHFHGVMKHPVCATWTIVHQMELAGRKLLEPHLEAQEEGIGAHISIDHISPAVIGSEVVVRATATEIASRKLVADVEAYCADRLLARGRFVQIILPKARLAALFDENAPPASD
ncbi:MAG: hypothetical protein KDA32_09530 [Phycisphaerales bacterium]|nr:hypothetical protein [Phycisphaerales bacterium]